jgi:hypothetical protein
MNRKNVSLNINEKDIKNVLATLLTSIFTRQVQTIQEKTAAASEGMQENNPDKMLAQIALLLESFDETAKDLAYASIMIGTWSETLPSETEVLEDLSDLKEDGLGVGGGSE